MSQIDYHGEDPDADKKRWAAIRAKKNKLITVEAAEEFLRKTCAYWEERLARDDSFANDKGNAETHIDYAEKVVDAAKDGRAYYKVEERPYGTATYPSLTFAIRKKK